MLSRLDSILRQYIDEYEIKLNSSQEGRLRLLEKHLDNGSLGLSEAMTELRSMSLKGSKGFFKDVVYRDLEKKLGFNGIKERKEEPKEIKEKNQEQSMKPESKIGLRL